MLTPPTALCACLGVSTGARSDRSSRRRPAGIRVGLPLLTVLATGACQNLGTASDGGPSNDTRSDAHSDPADLTQSDADAEASDNMVQGPYSVTVGMLLAEATDLTHLARVPEHPYMTAEASSRSHQSVSPADPAGWFANDDSGNFLSIEEHGNRREYVMLDARGPGAVVRIWSANPQGTLRVYLEGATHPVLEAPMEDLLAGRIPPFGPPLAQEVGQGFSAYFPIPYRVSCKITTDHDGMYYQIHYRTYDSDTAVQSLSPALLRQAVGAASEANSRLAAPASPCDREGVRTESLALSTENGASNQATFVAPEGGGVIQEIRLQPSPHDSATLRGTLLQVVFDGEPAIMVPLGDFFGTGPGANTYQSLPFTVTPTGTLVSRWPMPFRTTATFTLTRMTGSPVRIDGQVCSTGSSWDDRTMLFHATWHPPELLSAAMFYDWNLISLAGDGVYVGTVLNVVNPSSLWWGEGDEKIYVDAEVFPSHFGTGTEDYFGYGWCWPMPFTHPLHNQTRADGPMNGGLISVNRFHIIDAIPFRRSLRFDLEIMHWDALATVRFDSVSYWYARPGTHADILAPGAGAWDVPTVPRL